MRSVAPPLGSPTLQFRRRESALAWPPQAEITFDQVKKKLADTTLLVHRDRQHRLQWRQEENVAKHVVQNFSVPGFPWAELEPGTSNVFACCRGEHRAVFKNNFVSCLARLLPRTIICNVIVTCRTRAF